MDNAQASHVIKFLNASWTAKPMDGSTAALWGAKLQRYDFAAVMAVLEDFVETLEWRPSLAQILKPLRTDDVPSASDAFAHIWEQIGKRPRKVSELEAEAVRLLGGWSTLGLWKLDERHYHSQRFSDVYDAAVSATERDRHEALSGSTQQALTGDDHALETT